MRKIFLYLFLILSFSSNLFAKENVGHTRQNFNKDMVLMLDGEGSGGVQHFERHNDLIFPTQGPRSF